MKRGHDGLRDSDAKLAELAWRGVSVEPVLQADFERLDRPCLQADWMVRGVWEGSRVAFFDERIIDADAPSSLQANLTWEAISNRATQAKKRKYLELAVELRASFTLLISSTDCVLHAEYSACQKRLAFKLSAKWQQPYSVIMAWVRVRTQFAIIRAVGLWCEERGVGSCHLISSWSLLTLTPPPPPPPSSSSSSSSFFLFFFCLLLLLRLFCLLFSVVSFFILFVFLLLLFFLLPVPRLLLLLFLT